MQTTGSREIRRVGIVGCGVMGSGIAQVCAQHGCPVVAVEKNPEVLEKGLRSIDHALSRLVAAEKLSHGQKASISADISGAVDLERLETCDLVIEAVTEDLNLKREIFKRLDAICPAPTILATNTSVLAVIALAQSTTRPEKVIGTHFLTPPPVIPLLEVIRTIKTSQATLETVKTFASRIGKQVVVSTDRPGFIVNRILTSILFSAVRLLEEGVATQEDIDTAVTRGLGMPFTAGPDAPRFRQFREGRGDAVRRRDPNQHFYGQCPGPHERDNGQCDQSGD
jgi:3-hydroxybutyryl-CoA dehydrogenase